MNIDTMIFKEKYKIKKKLGHGSFGEIYLIEDKTTKNIFAGKIEKKTTSKKSLLEHEYKIYEHLICNNFKYIPKIYWYGDMDNYHIIGMQKLDKSLEELPPQKNEICLLGIECMHIMESLHNIGIIHRDIKPANFMYGNNKLYVIDFGLAKKYMINEKHIEFRDKKSLIGTLRYVSLNMHLGIEPSRRDDLISIGYMLCYFYLDKKLPWQDKKDEKDIKHIKIQGINDLPKYLNDYLIYCNELKFDEMPDYNKLRGFFKNN